MTRSSKTFAVQILVSKIADNATFSPDGKSLPSVGELLSAVDGSKLGTTKFKP